MCVCVCVGALSRNLSTLLCVSRSVYLSIHLMIPPTWQAAYNTRPPLASSFFLQASSSGTLTSPKFTNSISLSLSKGLHLLHTHTPTVPLPYLQSACVSFLLQAAGFAVERGKLPVMMQQQDAGVKPPDGVNNSGSTAHMVSSSKLGRQKGGGSSNHTPDQVQKCPRCDSLNTKFCYYNNYSLSQPRHFCKNCRRYWTKGGALRNVPIGGGCRKNKRVKQRSPLDPTSLASLAEVESGAASNLLSSINGCPPLQLPASFSTPGPSTSSLITELANENHRYGLTFSRLQESMRLQDQSGAMPSTQGLFTLGGHPPPLMGTLAPFDPTFPSLSYPKPDPQAIMYHHHHGSALTPFYEHINSTPSMPTTLDHLSSFSSPSTHHVNTSSNNNSSMDAQLSLIHQNHLPLHMVNDGGGQFNEDQHTAGGGFEEESAGISMRRSKGKVILSSLSDWQLGPPSENLFSSSSANDQGNLWNVSWPEMHAALAGSTTAGAMLH